MTIRQKPAPSLQEIVDYVSEKLGMPVSVSSIQKDIYAMRYDESLGFNAPIEYDPQKRGYVYTDPNYSINQIPVSEEDLQGLEMAIGLLEQFKDIPAIKVFEDSINKLATAVKFSRDQSSNSQVLILDRPKRYQGIEWMTDIVDAIRQKNELRIQYQPFNRPDPRKHTVHPYFVKEYNGRMYLIGKDIHPYKASKFLTFAFDRMLDVIKMHRTFQEEMVDKENYFRSAIGISMTGQKPEKILLQFNPEQASYLKSQPIHHSQQIIRDTKKAFVIQLELVINYELMSLLFGFRDQLKILKPASLVEDMQKTIHRMQALYH
ncbi:MAG: helix-turn-helix transcriptional regulator [Chitinophagaceae bacterium]|jgi:predicted DNA-binding transcriptional regulator YafY